MNKRIMLIVIFTVVVLLTLPVILSGMMTIEFFGKALGSADGWLSYWGGYLGAMLGLAAIAVTTQIQINSQNRLHKKQLIAQEESLVKMHDLQKKIREYSIDESTKANDKKERDRIYMNLLIRKNEELIENLIELNFLISKRYNTLKDYVYYESYNRELKGKSSSYFERIILFGSTLDGNFNKEEMKVREQKLFNKIDEIKRNETEIRIKISDVSAKIKTRSMYFRGLGRQIDSYRIVVDSTLEEFYNHIDKNDIHLNDFNEKIEESWTEIHRLTNVILNSCQDNLLGIVNRFVNDER